MKPELLLQIYEHTCAACGNRWTHSVVIEKTTEGYSYAKDSSPLDLSQSITGYFVSHTHKPACHRCIPLGLGVGWKSAAYVPGPDTTRPRKASTKSSQTQALSDSSLGDLLDDITPKAK